MWEDFYSRQSNVEIEECGFTLSINRGLSYYYQCFHTRYGINKYCLYLSVVVDRCNVGICLQTQLWFNFNYSAILLESTHLIISFCGEFINILVIHVQSSVMHVLYWPQLSSISILLYNTFVFSKVSYNFYILGKRKEPMRCW